MSKPQPQTPTPKRARVKAARKASRKARMKGRKA